METRPKRGFSRRHLVLLTLAIAVIAVTVFRYANYPNLQPRMDQASFTVWLQDLIEAPRLFPLVEGHESFQSALMRDENSSLNILLRRIYVVHDHVFVMLSLAWFAIWSMFLGWELAGQIAISVLSGTLAIAVVAWLPWVRRPGANTGEDPSRAAWISAAIFAFGAVNGYLSFFSALGVHNVGLLGLAFAVLATQSWLWRWQADDRLWPTLRMVATLAIAQSVAYYTHYTSVFLLPLATVLIIAFAPQRRKAAKIRALTAFIAAGIVSALPFLIVVLVARPETATDQDAFSRLIWILSQEGYSAADLQLRIVRWWSTMADYGSPTTLFLGLGGCLFLALREKAALPAALILVHFLASLWLPGFSQFNRTGSYALLILVLGAGWFAVVCAGMAITAWKPGERSKAAVIGSLLAFLIVSHASTETQRIADPHRISGWRHLLLHPGDDVRFVREVEALVPRQSALLPWDYRLRYAIRVQSQRLRGETRTLRPFESFIRELETGNLKSYAKKHGLHIPTDSPIYLLVPSQFEPRLFALAGPIFGPDGLQAREEVKLQRVKTLIWKRSLSPSGELGLYVIP